MELTVQNVYGLLLRSKLLSLDDAKAMYAKWQVEAKDQATDLTRFAAWMVANKYVTEYQASLLARGHAEGFHLNDYTILDRLGKGRMAGVYRARHNLGQIVAIKVLPPSRAQDATMLARFHREAKLSLKLHHPNIVRSFQMDVAGELHYLVMEYLDGTTLEELLLARKRLPPEEAVRLVHQALSGLQHIHEQGLVHRDLKPSNLMLVPSPQRGSTLQCTLKILDIGLGRAMFEEDPSATEMGLTSEGVLLGTPDYMAPEQARDPRLIDIRADIYSLGCVLYHLMSGQPPFPDTNLISQMIRHATEKPTPLTSFNPDIPEGLTQIVDWMIAKNPSERYPTPIRAAQALQVYLTAGGADLSSPDADPSMGSYLLWLEAENRKTKSKQKEEGEKSSPANRPELPPTVAIVDIEGKPSSGMIPVPPSGQSRKGKREKLTSDAIPIAPDEVPIAPPSKSLANEANLPKKDKPGKVAGREAGESRTGKRKEASVPPSGEPPIPFVEVELVDPAPSLSLADLHPDRLTRRDFFMFFLGVGSGLIAYAIGRGLAALFRVSRRDDSE